MQETVSQELSDDKSCNSIGKALDFVMYDEMAPGSMFFLPKGQYIYNKLVDLVREFYDKEGYDEVSTPIMCLSDLWKTSGHYDKYKDNMYFIKHKDEHDTHEREFGLCPMNCPKHILIFKQMCPSYRDLPLRLADFGALHRNESSGSLKIFLRNRLFHQDDAHIFCSDDHIEKEINSVLDMLDSVYKLFDFKYELSLSTRPEKFIGNVKTWDYAEDILKKVLTKHGEFAIKPYDGAFYGPKIDVMVSDSFGRKHQLGTIQLDFNLPERFNISYKGWDGRDYHPLMIHRAVFGSLERFMGILLEHTQGRLPLWLSPRKIMLVPVKIDFMKKCEEVKNELMKVFSNKMGIDIRSGETVPKSVLLGEQYKYNYICVIGSREVKDETITVRMNNKLVSMPLEEFYSKIKQENDERSRISLFE